MSTAPAPNPPWRPVVILGAGRSGTNMLRDVLTSLPGYATWPCDEINYMWRHGSRAWPHDALPAERANLSVQRYMHKRFAAQRRRGGVPNVVEKTCANTLRVPYVDRALAGRAVYLHIVRDGRDVAVSARHRWKASLDIPYLLRKARFVPPSDLSHYALRYLRARLNRLWSSERRVSSWGPRYPGIDEDLRTRPLGEVCARQWEACVMACRDGLAAEAPRRHLNIRYEAFAAAPVEQMLRVAEFLGEDWDQDLLARATSRVSVRSVGGWRRKLEPELAQTIEERHGESLAWAARADAHA